MTTIWDELDKISASIPPEEWARYRAEKALYTAAPEMKAALEKIVLGEGNYSRDRLEHATNCIESMKAIANAALAKANGETP